MSTCAVIRSNGHTSKHTSVPFGGAGAEDSQSLARVMRQASTGRDMGSDFNEVASRLEKGEGSQAVEASLRKRVGESMQPH
jgi:hypothetical protein